MKRYKEFAKKELRKELLNKLVYDKACIDQIDDAAIATVSRRGPDYVKIKARIAEIIASDVNSYYLGTTCNYKQRFCPNALMDESPVSINAHAHNYTKMFVLGKSFSKTVICAIEEKLIGDFPDADNNSAHCLGLKEDCRPYYVYLVVKENKPTDAK